MADCRGDRQFDYANMPFKVIVSARSGSVAIN
jgi:hypothetical protein